MADVTKKTCLGKKKKKLQIKQRKNKQEKKTQELWELFIKYDKTVKRG